MIEENNPVRRKDEIITSLPDGVSYESCNYCEEFTAIIAQYMEKALTGKRMCIYSTAGECYWGSWDAPEEALFATMCTIKEVKIITGEDQAKYDYDEYTESTMLFEFKTVDGVTFTIPFGDLAYTDLDHVTNNDTAKGFTMDEYDRYMEKRDDLIDNDEDVEDFDEDNDELEKMHTYTGQELKKSKDTFKLKVDEYSVFAKHTKCSPITNLVDTQLTMYLRKKFVGARITLLDDLEFHGRDEGVADAVTVKDIKVICTEDFDCTFTYKISVTSTDNNHYTNFWYMFSFFFITPPKAK